MKKAFTLIEMLVVIGIIAVLIAASLVGFSKMSASAERAKEQELVNNVATALAALFQQEGAWPRRLAIKGATNGKLDAETAFALVANGRNYLSLANDGTQLTGFDKFGIVTAKAWQTIKRLGARADLSSVVAGSSGTVDDHILHYALDLDGDGIVDNASVGNVSVSVRAPAIVWSCGKDGVLSPYPYGNGGGNSGGKGANDSKGADRNDDVYSWTPGQTRKIK